MSLTPFCFLGSLTSLRSVNAAGVISSLNFTSTDPIYIQYGGIKTNSPGLAVDAAGNIYVTDNGNNAVYKIDTHLNVTCIAGLITGLGYSGDGGLATSAGVQQPFGMALDAAGNVYFSDAATRVRAINRQSTTQTILGVSIPAGCIQTVAGNGSTGYHGDNGPATSATLQPSGVVLDPSGNLFIADRGNGVIRRVDHATGVITTVAGNNTAIVLGDNGPALSAEMFNPIGIALDSSGNIYVGDAFIRVRAVNMQATTQTILGVSIPSGFINTVAGNGTTGFSGDGAAAISAQIITQTRIAVDAAGNLFISDQENFRIRRVTTDGVINTVAGNGTTGNTGDGSAATSAQIVAIKSPVIFASPLAPVTAVIAENQVDAFPSANLAGTFVRFRLRGITGVPQVNGNPVTVTATMAAGSISQSLWPNSSLVQPGTFYTIEMWSNSRITSSMNAVINASIDLSNVTPR